jgi:hypothetical protein
MISMDPPQHTRVRALVAKAFTRRRVVAMEPIVREITRERLAGLEPGMQINLFEQFASSMPMDVISSMLGVPAEHRDRVRHLTNEMMHREPGKLDVSNRHRQIGAELFAAFNELIDARRKRPQPDLISALLEVELEGEDGRPTRLTQLEILGFCMLLGNAGHETTARLICNSAVTLARHPDQRRELVNDPSLLPDAVEELLRYDPPSQVQGFAGAPDRSSCTVSRSQRMSASCCSPGPRNATRASTTRRTASTSAARSSGTSPSASASTCVWESRWLVRKAASPSKSCWRASRTTSSMRRTSSGPTTTTCGAMRRCRCASEGALRYDAADFSPPGLCSPARRDRLIE